MASQPEGSAWERAQHAQESQLVRPDHGKRVCRRISGHGIKDRRLEGILEDRKQSATVERYSLIFFFFMAAPAACRSAQARGPTGAAAAGLRYSHSNARSELHLRPTLQLLATLDP